MIGGLFDPNSTAVNNVIKDASDFGKQQAPLGRLRSQRGRAAPERPVPAGRRQQRQDDVRQLRHRRRRARGADAAGAAQAITVASGSRRLRHTGRVLPPGDAVPDPVEGAGVLHAAVVRHPRHRHVPEPAMVRSSPRPTSTTTPTGRRRRRWPAVHARSGDGEPVSSPGRCMATG